MLKINTWRMAVGLLGAISVFGCATTPWHEDLMNNEQLMGANCAELAQEQLRVADNAKHTAEASTVGTTGAVFLAVLEGMASGATNTPVNADNSGAVNSARLASEHSRQAAQLESRKNMIDLLRSKKNCN